MPLNMICHIQRFNICDPCPFTTSSGMPPPKAWKSTSRNVSVFLGSMASVIYWFMTSKFLLSPRLFVHEIVWMLQPSSPARPSGAQKASSKPIDSSMSDLKTPMAESLSISSSSFLGQYSALTTAHTLYQAPIWITMATAALAQAALPLSASTAKFNRSQKKQRNMVIRTEPSSYAGAWSSTPCIFARHAGAFAAAVSLFACLQIGLTLSTVAQCTTLPFLMTTSTMAEAPMLSPGRSTSYSSGASKLTRFPNSRKVFDDPNIVIHLPPKQERAAGVSHKLYRQPASRIKLPLER
mmetsp:Transcript_20029/g.58162  ORF Transcript_20029/g.58162 Transcript_20029/m.58162 type:complete len:295 (-) Transcript_20029:636-1520(-)